MVGWLRGVVLVVLLLANFKVGFDRFKTLQKNTDETSSSSSYRTRHIHPELRDERLDDSSSEPSPRLTRRIVGFYHLGAMNDWKTIMHEQFTTLRSSGLLRATKSLFIGILSRSEGIENIVVDLIRSFDTEVELNWLVDPDFELYESLTLGPLYAFCQANPTYFVYYFHSKGTSTSRKTLKYKLAKEWRYEMEHFLFTRWEDVYSLLEEGLVSTVGTNYYCYPYPHYSGNFWWSSCKFLEGHTPPQIRSPSWYKRSKWIAHGRMYDEAWLLDVDDPDEIYRIAECLHNPTPRYYPIKNKIDLSTLHHRTCETPTIAALYYNRTEDCLDYRVKI